MTNSIQLKCDHNNHLFTRPLCAEQVFLRKIANVFFHIITLGLPLAIYHLWSGCFSSTHAAKLALPIRGDLPFQNIPLEGEQAIAFAMEKLKQSPVSEPHPAPDQTSTPPMNPQFEQLERLFHDQVLPDFLAAREKTDSWDHPDVITAADALMKTAYTLSVLSLKELEPFVQRLERVAKKKTYTEVIADQSVNLGIFFEKCPHAYHWIRGEYTNQEIKNGCQPMNPTSPEHTLRFYQKDTAESLWRLLFNDLCDRARMYMKMADLYKPFPAGEPRVAIWITKDTNPETYQRSPKTHS